MFYFLYFGLTSVVFDYYFSYIVAFLWPIVTSPHLKTAKL